MVANRIKQFNVKFEKLKVVAGLASYSNHFYPQVRRSVEDEIHLSVQCEQNLVLVIIVI